MKSRDVFKRWKKRSLKFKIFTGVGIVIILLTLPLILLAAILTFATKSSFAEVWDMGMLYGLWATAILAMIIFALFEYRTLGSRRVLKVNKNLEDSHFMSAGEIDADKSFTVVDFTELGNVADGLLIKAERQKDKIEVVLMNPIHAMLIATTGTGKTTTYIEPSIEILAHTKTKPCMVVTDPKGELYDRHASTLKTQGYNVHSIDLTDTYHSTLWNPFNDVIRKTEKISEPITQAKNKYRWGGRLYETYASAEREKNEFTVKLNDEIYVDLQDLIYTACPVEAAQDKSWQQGARDLLFAMALRMWEDFRDGYMPKEKFNLYNLWWNLTEYGKPNPETEMCDILLEYVDKCADEISRAAGMGNTVLVSQDRTLTSYLGSVNQYLHWMADGGVAQLTSGNEVEFGLFDDEPNALFIKIPDMKEGRHGLVALMLLQLYKALDEKGEINKANNETEDKQLKRHCYFLMDEFGSLPQIRNFDNIVKIARSLGVFLVPVLQDYAQLTKVYGEHAANTIKNNCNVKIFMGTNDEKTRAEISEGCGKHKVKSVGYSENKDMGVNTSAQSVPLVYPSELSKLNEPKNGIYGNAIILAAGTYPITSHTTPFFLAKDLYGLDEHTKLPKKDFMIFDEQTNRYDITKLIFLHQFLDEDNESGNAEPETLANITQADNAQTETAPTDEMITGQIMDACNELKGKIREEDLTMLLLVEDSLKIMLLDEIAEKATLDGNIFLAMQVEKIIGIIKHCLKLLKKENVNYA